MNVQLIKAKCNNNYPLCVHYAFLVNNRVIHNTPSKVNPFGGNIIVESFNTFKKEREIFSIEPLNVSAEKILSYYEKNKDKKFNYLTYNCEQFINDAINGNKSTSLLMRWLLFLGGSYYLINKL